MNIFKAKSIDATNGPLLQKIILYAIPLMLTTLIQQLFNAIDIVVLGNMADTSAVASVGATTAIVALLVNSFIGIAAGARVVIARHIGADDKDKIRSAVDTSLIMSIGLGVIIAVVGFIFVPWFLEITNCPDNCFEGALLYTRIYILGAPFILFYNFGAATVTASGDTQRPLYYIMAGGVTNVILNIILCLILPQKVIAVAIATVASQIVASVLVANRLLKMEGHCRVVASKMRFKLKALFEVLKYGFPMALTNALFPLSNLQIQSAVNSFGDIGMAGYSASGTVESVLSAFYGPIGTTAATFIGQNIGAEKHDRVRKTFYNCMWLSVGIGGCLGILTFLTGRFWLSLILGADISAIDFGIIRMSCTTFFVFVSAANQVYANALQAYGYSTFSAVNSIFCVFVFRMIWMSAVYPEFDGYGIRERFYVLMICFVVSWTLRLLVNIVGFALVRRKYKIGIRNVI